MEAHGQDATYHAGGAEKLPRGGGEVQGGLRLLASITMNPVPQADGRYHNENMEAADSRPADKNQCRETDPGTGSSVAKQIRAWKPIRVTQTKRISCPALYSRSSGTHDFLLTVLGNLSTSGHLCREPPDPMVPNHDANSFKHGTLHPLVHDSMPPHDLNEWVERMCQGLRVLGCVASGFV